jgi:tetratricopeptide (TPR) repeat protein
MGRTSFFIVLGLSFWLSYGSATPAFALPFPSNFQDYQELRLAALDDPQGATDMGFRLWQTLDRHKEPKRWVMLLSFLLQTQADFSTELDLKLSPAEISDIIKEARVQGFQAEALRLSFFRPRSAAELVPEIYRADVNQHIAAAEAAKLPVLQAEFISKKAFFEYNQAFLSQSIQDEQKALEILEAHPEPSGIPLHELKQFMAISVDDGTDDERAAALFQDVLNFFRARQVRFLSALTANNLGEDYTRQGKHQEAVKVFQESLKMTETMPNTFLRAASLTSLAQVFLELKNPDKAMEYVFEAEQLIRRAGIDPNLAVQVLYLKTLVHYRRGQLQEALREAVKIPPEYLDRNLSWKEAVRRIQSYAYRAQGDFKKAYDHLYESQIINFDLAEQNAHDQLHKFKVKMGLKLEEQKNAQLKQENDHQKVRLHEAERFRRVVMIVLVLFLIVMVLMAVALAQARVVKRTKIKMQRILDNIEEGILTIDTHLHVESSFSPYLNQILGLSKDSTVDRQLFGAILERSDLGADERQLLREALRACLGEGMLAWELNEAHLPLEIKLDKGEKVLGLHWQPLLDAHGHIQNILIAIRDNTLRRQLQNKVSETHHRMDHLQLKLREILDADPRRAIPFLRELQSKELSSLLTDQSTTQDYRHLHTIKGTARSLGLKELAERVHELENHIGPRSTQDPKARLQAWEAYQQTLEDYSELCSSFMIDHSHALARSRSLNLLDAVAFHMPGILDLLQKAQLEFAGIDVQDEVHPWDRNLLEKIDDVLLHALTNSVEHGFIRPRERGRSVAAARFHVHAWENGGSIHLEVRDNGVGVDWERLQERARQKNLPLDNSALQSLLFAPGFSTAETVSQNSGRGIGLSVIKQISDELGADAELNPAQGSSGACLHLTIPRTRFHQSA